MTLLRLDASIRTEGSYRRRLADVVEREWLSAHPGAEVTRRDLGVDPIPSTAWPLAVGAMGRVADELTDAERDAVGLATRLTDELVGADSLLLAVPLYNWGVSQHVKAWVDLVMTDPRAGTGPAMALAGRSAVLVTVRGGGYSPGTPRHGWDHATDWMRRILADVWQLDLDLVETELTLAEHRPYLAQFVDLSRQLHAKAEIEAARLGGLLGGRRAG